MLVVIDAFRRLSNWVVPASAPRCLIRGFWLFAVLSAAFWGLGILGAWRGWDWRSTSLVHDAAVATVILAGLCWADAQRYDRDMRMLTRQNADLYHRIPEDDRPPVLREASGR